MLVGEILDQKGNQIYEVGPDWPVRKTFAMLAAWNIGAALVTDFEGLLLGIISERDLVRSLNEFGGSVLRLRVSDLMTRSVITCTPEATISDALSLMALHRIRHLPVVRDTKILGLISIRDVLEFRLEALEEHFAALNRAREEAELSNRSKTEFLANISHELKTPLNAVIGFAELLTRQADGRLSTGEYVQYLHEIEKSGRHLLTMVDDLLDLSRIDIKALELAEEDLSVPALVSTCIQFILERAERTGVTLVTNADAALPMLFADRRMIKQMLSNLLSNAVKFTPAGGKVSVRCVVDNCGGIRVCVTDTGIGIAQENLAKVVEPFYQAEASIARRYEGAGLGLALVNAMIQAHGGGLSLDSKLGAGTTATLHFPSARTIAPAGDRLSGQSEAFQLTA
jgi:signal transduction histidine kinase